MAHVLLVGEGPLPRLHDGSWRYDDADARDTSFAQLRAHQFHAALVADGHTVRFLDARGLDTDGWRARWRLARRTEVRSPEVVVSAGTWAPVRVALAMAGDRPLCIDLPGDPFADAQAAIHAPGSAAANAGATAAAQAATALFVAALRRGDAFTTIGEPSRYALLGQLGVLGRLARTPPGDEQVHVTPIACAFPGIPERRERARETDLHDGAQTNDAGGGVAQHAATPLRITLFGGFNTWLDEDATAAGLLRAMDRRPMEVTVVGGPIPGHHEAGYARLRARVEASRHAASFTWLPRLAPEALADVLDTADATCWIDRPGAEPELGSRTRALLAAWRGVHVVTTARCELVRDLVREGHATAVPWEGDRAVHLADTLVALDLSRRHTSRASTTLLTTTYSIAATTRGLRDWVADARVSPTRLPMGRGG